MTAREPLLGAMFDDAMKLRNAGDLAAARKLLTAVVEQIDHKDVALLAHSHMQLGYVAKLLADHGQIEPNFRVATVVLPSNELASLGLFHALFNLGRFVEAHQEMVRLLRRRSSKMYRELLTPKYGEEFRGELAQLLGEARELLQMHRRRLLAKDRRS